MDKRQSEKDTFNLMIEIYDKAHQTNHIELKDYAFKRIDVCPYMEIKTFCSQCSTPCYKQDMRDQIKKVMRYSGPLMIFKRPILTIKHLRYSIFG